MSPTHDGPNSGRERQIQNTALIFHISASSHLAMQTKTVRISAYVRSNPNRYLTDNPLPHKASNQSRNNASKLSYPSRRFDSYAQTQIARVLDPFAPKISFQVLAENLCLVKFLFRNDCNRCVIFSLALFAVWGFCTGIYSLYKMSAVRWYDHSALCRHDV